MLQLIDPVTGAPHPAKGTDGRLVTAPPPDGSAITPDNLTVYDPPVIVTVWDSTAQSVAIVPYGLLGDSSVTYPTKPGMTVPVLARQVLATGTTATVLRGQSVYIPGVAQTTQRLLDEGSGLILTEDGTPIELESGP